MGPSLYSLLAFGGIAALANVAGGLILLPQTIRVRIKGRLRYLLAIGAGFMLAVTLLEVLPRTLAVWSSGEMGSSWGSPMVFLLGGYLLTQLFEHAIAPHFHLAESPDPGTSVTATAAYSGVAGFLIHAFFDGVMIAAAAQIGNGVGVLVFVAVVIHKFPEGFTIGSLILAAGRGPRGVFVGTAAVGAATIAGLVAYVLVGAGYRQASAVALPVACGVMLYVAASDLVPEVNHYGGIRWLISAAIFAGVLLYFVVHWLLEMFTVSGALLTIR